MVRRSIIWVLLRGLCAASSLSLVLGCQDRAPQDAGRGRGQGGGSTPGLERRARDGRCDGVMGHPRQDCQYPSYDGFELVLAEEFESPIDLDRDPLWTWSDGYSDLGHCRYIKEAITFRGGRAVITMDRPAVPVPIDGYPTFAEGLRSEYPAKLSSVPELTSGEIRTKFNMFRYGRYEFRVKAPKNTTGNFMASGFIFRTPKWQDWREIDFELQARSPRAVQSNVVFGQEQSRYDGRFADDAESPVPFDTQDEFHTYVIEWLPKRIRWYVDPELRPRPIREYRPGMKVRIPDSPGKLMMNLWAWHLRIENNRYPMHYEIDWVRFYRSEEETKNLPCSSPPSCLTDADIDYSKNNPSDGIPVHPSGR